MENNDELFDIIGDSKKVKIRNEIYIVSPCSLFEYPKLEELLSKMDEIASGDSNLIDAKSRELMAKIMYMGLKRDNGDITEKQIMDNFPLSAYPVILNIMLDLNDFLSKMRKVQEPVIAMKQMTNTRMEGIGHFPQQRIKTKKISEN